MGFSSHYLTSFLDILKLHPFLVDNDIRIRQPIGCCPVKSTDILIFPHKLIVDVSDFPLSNSEYYLWVCLLVEEFSAIFIKFLLAHLRFNIAFLGFHAEIYEAIIDTLMIVLFFLLGYMINSEYLCLYSTFFYSWSFMRKKTTLRFLFFSFMLSSAILGDRVRKNCKEISSPFFLVICNCRLEKELYTAKYRWGETLM